MSVQSVSSALFFSPEKHRHAHSLNTAYHFSVWVIVAVIMAIVTISAFGAYVLTPVRSQGTVVPEACTAEAKLCADGSTVSRTGPQCQFPACPGE